MRVELIITQQRRSWWQKVLTGLRRWARPTQPALQLSSREPVIEQNAEGVKPGVDLGVVAHTPMGSMMSDLQRQSAAVRVAAEQTRALVLQVGLDAQAATQRLLAQRNQEPPPQDAMQLLAEQVKELRERVLQSEERIQNLMEHQLSLAPPRDGQPLAGSLEAGSENAQAPLVSEGQLTVHPILRHARSANQ